MSSLSSLPDSALGARPKRSDSLLSSFGGSTLNMDMTAKAADTSQSYSDLVGGGKQGSRHKLDRALDAVVQLPHWETIMPTTAINRTGGAVQAAQAQANSTLKYNRVVGSAVSLFNNI